MGMRPEAAGGKAMFSLMYWLSKLQVTAKVDDLFFSSILNGKNLYNCVVVSNDVVVDRRSSPELFQIVAAASSSASACADW